MMNSKSMSQSYPSEELLAEFFKSFGNALMLVGWKDDEVNAGFSYIRGQFEAGATLGDAVVGLYKAKDEGRLT